MAEKKITKKVVKKEVKTKVVKAETSERKVQFAVVDINATQVIVREGQTLEVKKIDVIKGKKYESDKVLLVVDGDKVSVGKPYVKGALVTFTVLAQTRGKKVESMIYKAKSRYRKHIGSRASLTKLEVKKIEIKAK